MSNECSEMVFFAHQIQTQILLDIHSNWANVNLDPLFSKVLTAEPEVVVSLDAVGLFPKLRVTTRLYWPTTVEKVSRWLVGGWVIGRLGWLVG